MRARVRQRNLPDAPHYEGNVGKPVDADVEVSYTDDGRILECKRHVTKLYKLDYRPRKRLPPPTPEELTQIREMMDRGKGTKDIAKVLKRPEGSVRRYERMIRGDKR